jgi:Cu-Zn family superoxide dismutase
VLCAVSSSAVVAFNQDPQPRQRTTHAVAVVFPTTGSSVSGTVRLIQTDGGTIVAGEITGLAPGSKHGFHIHEFGDMTVKDGTGMGSHYNPNEMQHGLPDQAMRHVGDLGNIEADEKGVAKFHRVIEGMALTGRSSVLGRGIVVHEKPDDGGQPVGNAGARIGYGVIGVAKAE